MAFATLVVCPGFEDNTHYSGLRWDTRFRLLAAAIMFDEGYSKQILVGGAQIRQMKESFAVLMKRYLVDVLELPSDVVATEEYTFDAASQFEWLDRHRQRYPEKIAVVTDKYQAWHVNALIRGYKLNAEVKTIEPFLRRYDLETTLYSKPDLAKWILREAILASITRLFDHRGKLMQRITSNRKQV